MNIKELRNAAVEVVSLLDDYSGDHVGKREMLSDPILYAYLRSRFEHITRQHEVWMSGWKHAKRIDLRQGGPNPVLIEFAVRPRQGGGHLGAYANRSELRKLTRIKTKLRVLLLVDLHREPLDRSEPKASYEEVPRERGAFVHHTVRVLYVHRKTSFSFACKP